VRSNGDSDDGGSGGGDNNMGDEWSEVNTRTALSLSTTN
jgi:hypothetical protein